jgi:hypothetical protein
MTDQEVKKVLANMLINFKAIGWTQGTFQNSDGEVCLVESFNTTQRNAGVDARGFAGEGAMQIANVLGFPSPSAAAAWNDTPGRTEDEIKDLIRAAIRGEITPVEPADDVDVYDGEPYDMEIGKKQRTIIVEPTTIPVPQPERAPAPAREPVRRREQAPEREPERVPEHA